MFNEITQLCSAIPAFDKAAFDAALARQNQLTKPTGSLGVLEGLSCRIAGMTGKKLPVVDPVAILVFAADHGVAARGVSAYPSEVTAQMVANFARGGAVINVVARQIGAQLTVADVGVAADLAPDLPILHRKVRHGTADWTKEAAMSESDLAQAWRTGQKAFAMTPNAGLTIVGEMGIGNSTTAAALTAAFIGCDPEEVVGWGTGIDDPTWARKLAVVKAGLERHAALTDPAEILAALGGLEIAAMTSAILASAAKRVPVLLDGFIATSAALAAVRLCPQCRDYLIAAHRSPEPGHTIALQWLGLSPLLDLGMRLGEASGAALAVPIVRASVAILRETATFEGAGVSDREAVDSGAEEAAETIA